MWTGWATIAIAGSSEPYTGMMKSLLLRRAKWAFEPCLLWTSAILLFVTAVVLLVVHPNLLSGVAGLKQEQVIRWWDVALQMVGILAVLNDLWNLRGQFRLESASTWRRKWLARWPSRSVVLNSEGVGAATQTGSATSARGYVGPEHSATAEVRLSALEQHVHALWGSWIRSVALSRPSGENDSRRPLLKPLSAHAVTPIWRIS